MGNKYSFQDFNKETMAKAYGSNLQISFKKSVEVSRRIRGKKLSYVISYLEKVVDKKIPVPYIRFNAEVPHRKGKGISSGGYPVNVSKAFIKLLNSAKKNASEQEISGELYVLGVSANKGTKRYRPGRFSGRLMKSTNVEVIIGLKIKNENLEVVKK